MAETLLPTVPEQQPVATPVEQPKPQPNPGVEGLRQYLNSLGRSGDAYAEAYYSAQAKGGDEAKRYNDALSANISKAWNNKNTTGKGDVLGLPNPNGNVPASRPTRTGRVRAASAPKQAAPRYDETTGKLDDDIAIKIPNNPFTAPRATPEGDVVGGWDAFVGTIKNDFFPSIVRSAAKIAADVVEEVVDPRMGVIAPGKRLSDLSPSLKANKVARQASTDQAQTDLINSTPQYKGQDKLPFEYGADGFKINFSGTGQFWGNVVNQLVPTVAVGLTTRGAGNMAKGAMWATQVAQTVPSMYAEGRRAGLSPDAATSVAYLTSSVVAGLDVATGIESQIGKLAPDALKTASLKAFGKSFETARGVMAHVNYTTSKTAIGKLATKLGKAASEISVADLDEPTLQAFQASVRDEKAGLLKRLISNPVAKAANTAATASSGAVGEAAGAFAEKAIQSGYDTFLSGDGTSAGQGQFGTELWSGQTLADIGNEMAGGFFAEGAMSAGGNALKNYSVQSAYGAMEAEVRRGGDVGGVVLALQNKINQQEERGELDVAQADRAKFNLQRMGEVAVNLASRTDLSAQNKFDLFEISAKHLDAREGTQVRRAGQIGNVEASLALIDSEIEQATGRPDVVAALTKEKTDLLAGLGEPSIEAARERLTRRQVFLEGAEQAIISGKPNYNRLANGLNAIRNFSVGQTIVAPIESPTTGSIKRRVRTITALSEDGQVATLETGQNVRLENISDPALHTPTEAGLNAYNEAVARRKTITQNAPAETATNEGDFDGVDESWRTRVSNTIARPDGDITIREVPQSAFDMFGDWVNPALPARQEAVLSGKTVLLALPTGEEAATFMGYNAAGQATFTTPSEEYALSPQAVFGRGGLFRGVIADEDVETVRSQQQVAEPGDEADLTGDDLFSVNAIPEYLRNAPPLTEEEREAAMREHALTISLAKAIGDTSVNKFVADAIMKVMEGLIPGDVNSYIKAQDGLRKIGSALDVDTADAVDLLQQDIDQLIDDAEREAENGNGVAQGQPAGGNRR